jgi:hypothetical protein
MIKELDSQKVKQFSVGVKGNAFVIREEDLWIFLLVSDGSKISMGDDRVL